MYYHWKFPRAFPGRIVARQGQLYEVDVANDAPSAI
jgi:hypothetical protein